FVSPVFRTHAAEQRFGRRYWLPLGFASAGLCWLAYSSLRAASDAGLTQAGRTLVQQARFGDVLVDRSKLRVAFVQPPLFAAAAAAQVVASEFDASLPDLGVLGAPRAGLLFRESRDAPLARALRQLGSVVDEGRSGLYRWLLVEPAPIVASLPMGLSGGAFRSSGQVFPLEAGRLGLAPRVPSAIDVRETRCLVAGRSRRMLFAHPSDRGRLELAFVTPARARRLVLLAGFDDRVVRWGRAEVEVRVFFDDTLAGQLRVRNLPGMQWAVFSRLPGGSRRSKLEITTPDDRQRWLCVDGAWL
ncbi:MAG TPA: hypothetical protein VFU02_06200, partial [Polyangiaceae bacterium]|nr:hypothetical protein [Polyangiaceae bacterium]